MVYWFGAVAAVIGLAFWLRSKSVAFDAQFSHVIAAPAKDIIAKICDLPAWAEFSPWHVIDPQSAYEYSPASDDRTIDSPADSPAGRWFEWQSPHTGSGRITLIHVSEDAVDMQLDFYSPMRSQSSARFELVQREEGTEVTWSMHGQMPMYLKPMLAKMRQMLQNDFAIGLYRLDSACNNDAERFEMEFSTEERSPIGYIYSPYQGTLAGFKQHAKNELAAIGEYLKKEGLPTSAALFAVNNVAKLKHDYFDIEVAAALDDIAEDCPYEVGHLKGGNYLKLQYSGSYERLVHVWGFAFTYARLRGIKVDSRRRSLESYVKFAMDDTAVTHILIPISSQNL